MPEEPACDPKGLFRPLRGGVRIVNPFRNEVGTLGFIGVDGARRFVVSCAHVLDQCDQGPTPGVFQPSCEPANLIAAGAPRLGASDCAAVEVAPEIGLAAEILILGTCGSPAALTAGMHVRKCGSTTGLTEGVVRVVGGEFLVAPLPSSPAAYRLTDTGDSGALFVEAGGCCPVALCRGARVVGGRTWAVLVPIVDVLGELGLEFLA
jgi:hypothetical protein